MKIKHNFINFGKKCQIFCVGVFNKSNFLGCACIRAPSAPTPMKWVCTHSSVDLSYVYTFNRVCGYVQISYSKACYRPMHITEKCKRLVDI